MSASARNVTPAEIAERIFVVRGQRVLLSADLAILYGVTPRRLAEQYRRNRNRFPADFAFALEIKEIANLRTQFAASSWGGLRGPSIVFTEHGAIMVAGILRSPRAIQVSVYVVRAFVQLRRLVASNTEIARKLEALERSVAKLDVKTRQQFADVYQAIRALMTPTEGKKRSIGFTANLEGDER